MSVKAYILVNLVATDLAGTIHDIRKVKGVNFSDAVTGPYDAIAQVEAENINKIGKIVTSGILKVKGAAKSLTCVAV
jgi:DNA-binding Lrp family transcriptional regulator